MTDEFPIPRFDPNSDPLYVALHAEVVAIRRRIAATHLPGQLNLSAEARAARVPLYVELDAATRARAKRRNELRDIFDGRAEGWAE